MILKKFIVLEGIDGAGTSTQIERLRKRLINKRAFFTAEPTKNETGRFIRTVLKGDVKLFPTTIAYLFAADRCEHLYGATVNQKTTEQRDSGIIERCNNGELCVSDRYLFSSLAYQSLDCGKKLPYALNAQFPLPEIVFYFVIPPAVSLRRISGRGVTEIYEQIDFLEKTYIEYERVFVEYEKKHPKMRIVRIDATKNADEIEKIIWTEIEKLPIQDM
ncbi:MAG TPA: dTMP kinase [Treponemataceae bacterium]|nr:dTMP kinase [Treponemataceae bacterium]